MTQAIMQFGNTMNKGQEMCVEFALSSGTSKIGSCIPCSIFMEASGMPATATHWGVEITGVYQIWRDNRGICWLGVGKNT